MPYVKTYYHSHYTRSFTTTQPHWPAEVQSKWTYPVSTVLPDHRSVRRPTLMYFGNLSPGGINNGGTHCESSLLFSCVRWDRSPNGVCEFVAWPNLGGIDSFTLPIDTSRRWNPGEVPFPFQMRWRRDLAVLTLDISFHCWYTQPGPVFGWDPSYSLGFLVWIDIGFGPRLDRFGNFVDVTWRSTPRWTRYDFNVTTRFTGLYDADEFQKHVDICIDRGARRPEHRCFCTQE